MNLIAGEWYDDAASEAVLDTLEARICKTLAGPPLRSQTVVDACDRFSQKMQEAQMLPLLAALGLEEARAREEMAYAKTIMSKPYLEARLKRELGTAAFNEAEEFVPLGETTPVRQAWRPLGTLLHIAAGNVDALPVYSVVEGLLAGNINILKLPGGGDDLSALLLAELIKEEPRLADSIYVFDTPSEDTEKMRKMAGVADAVVVWGGDAAVRAVRTLAPANTKIIEWGHKVSFAYVSGADVSDEKLRGIAFNMWQTQQLYCNSCQGIYLNTDNLANLREFGAHFADILAQVIAEAPRAQDVFLRAQVVLQVYTERLETAKQQKWVYPAGPDGSVIVYPDSALAPSYHFGNCWVRPLPQDKIIETLHPHKNHLQTVALVCEDAYREALAERFLRLGVVRLTSGRGMSQNYCGMPHDGEWPLARYMKRISWEEG